MKVRYDVKFGAKTALVKTLFRTVKMVYVRQQALDFSCTILENLNCRYKKCKFSRARETFPCPSRFSLFMRKSFQIAGKEKNGYDNYSSCHKCNKSRISCIQALFDQLFNSVISRFQALNPIKKKSDIIKNFSA